MTAARTAMPVMTFVGRSPMAPATAPATATPIGAMQIDTVQSTDDTRPSSDRGTSACRSDCQMTLP
jgi:hypothetical protein